MKTKLLSTFAAIAISAANVSTASADGFVCQNYNESLVVKVFSHTQPEAGTRNAAVMILSDPTIQYGRKTIARFTDLNHTLNNTGAHYQARVDLRFNDSGRKGELIGGTKLGHLRGIDLDVDFTYADPLFKGQVAPALLSLTKRNGEVLGIEMTCERYLKH